MRRTSSRLALVALALPLLLAGCGDEEKSTPEDAEPRSVAGRLELGEGTASIVLPEGWVESFEPDGTVVLGATNTKAEDQQLFVNLLGSRQEAQDVAITVANAWAGAGDECRRDEVDDTFGDDYWLVDCYSAERHAHRLVIVMGDATRGSALVFYGAGDERKDLAPLVTPILESWTWS